MSDYRLLIRRTGGPEVIEREDIVLPSPGAGEVVIRHEAIGLNFIDTYQRSGLYPVTLPSGLGSEAAGTIEAVGAGVANVAVGDRVGYATSPIGSYASAWVMDAGSLVRLPDGIAFDTAAAVMLKGLTADMLVGECGRVEAGQTVLVHSAAGGVGSLLVPWLKALGAIVVAHAGTPEKAARAVALGADHGLSGDFAALSEEVRTIIPSGVDTVFDGVGKASWEASLGSLKRRGLMVSFGNASGAVPAIEPLALSRAGSLFLTRPTLFHYVETRERLEAAATRLFARIEDGTVKPDIGQRFPLADAAEAHRAIAARETTGSTVLIP